MEVTFLGVGAALPSAGETNASYLVRTDRVTLLIDCGPAVLQQLAAVGLTPADVTHLFVSHRHGDHALGFPLFLLWWVLDPALKDKPRPPILASRITWTSLLTLWEHTYGELPTEPLPWVELPGDPGHVTPLTDGVVVQTWPMNHSDFAPVLGVRVEAEGHAVAFTADTAPCPHVLDLARHADLLVHDCNFSATVEPRYPDDSRVHSTARTAGMNAAAAGARRLALVHVGRMYDGRRADLVHEAQAVFAGPVTAPADGDVERLPGTARVQ